MITDAELYELEMLLIDKYKYFDFSRVSFDRENGLVLINDNQLKMLVEMFFNDRYKKLGEDFVISYDIFKILQSRYFRENTTVTLVQK